MKAREKELNEREKQLKSLEQDLKNSGAVLKKKNWPICFPILHHDIKGEIPPGSRRVVWEMYICWWGLLTCMSWQFFCASVILGTDASDKVPSWFLSIVYFILGIPLAFWGWYLFVYRAAKNKSTFRWVFFFVFFLVHCGFCIWASIAVPLSASRWSLCGWVTALVAFDEGTFPGVVYIIGAVLWTLEALWSLWCLKDSFLFFRGKGGIKEQNEAKEQAAVAQFAASGGGQPQTAEQAAVAQFAAQGGANRV